MFSSQFKGEIMNEMYFKLSHWKPEFAESFRMDLQDPGD